MTAHWAAEQWFAFLIDCTLKTSILVLGAWLATFLLRGKSAAGRHLVWAAALSSAALLPVCSILMPAWHTSFGVPVTSRLEIGPEVRYADAHLSTVVDASLAAESVFTTDKVAVFVWLLGCGIGILILAGGALRLARIASAAQPFFDSRWNTTALALSRRLNLKRTVRVRRSTSHPMLVTWGALHPELLVPPDAQQWTAKRVHSVLGHELAHVARHDWFIHVLAEVVRTFYWFNPLLWLACNRMQQEAECACDDAVLSAGIEGPDYAGELLALARQFKTSSRSWSPSLAMARQSTLERRFAAMLNPSIDRRSISRKTAIATFFLSLCLVLPVAAMRAPLQSGPGSLSGSIYDAQGTPIENAIVIATDPTTGKLDMTSSNMAGVFQLRLPAGQYNVHTAVKGFLPFEADAISVEPGQETNLNILTLAAASANPQPAPAVQQPPARIRQGGNVAARNLITKIQPKYPAAARAAGIQGAVILEVEIDSDGVPGSMIVVTQNADPDLVQAAVNAVKQWRYKPTLLNGQPVSVVTNVTVNFSLQPNSAPAAAPAAEKAREQAEAAVSPSSTPATLADSVQSCASDNPCRLRIGGNVMQSKLIPQTKVEPAYPSEAKAARIQGSVVLEAVIGTEGTVNDLRVVSGHPLLVRAAIDSVKQWKYQPSWLNGRPVEVTTTITVNFSLGQ